MPDGQTTWFLDQASLLEELKKSNVQRGRVPIIAGYDDLREISRGGQGVVYAATQRSTRRKVAIKVLLDGAFSSNAARRRFEREIDLVAGLKHPNIVQVYDSGSTAPPDERLYFVMEFIDGLPLTDHARNRPMRDKLVLFADICEAVNYAHQRGVIHRDLKPSNIRVDSSGRPHVLDFGLAKAAGSSARDGMTMSVSGQFLGSLPWASPEQAEGAMERIDTRSDVYALGVVLFQLLTEKFPYDVEASFREVLDNILNTEPSRPSIVDHASNDEIDTIVLKCLAKDPSRRYQTAGDLSRDIKHYLAGEPIDAKRDSMWYTMRKRLQRYRLLAAAALLLLLALVGGFAATLWQAHKADQQRQRADEERYNAERRFNDVRNLAHAFIFEFNDQIRDLAGSRPARESLVRTALQYLQNLSSQASEDEGLQAELAAAWQQVGDIQGDPYQSNLGDTAGAFVSYQRAYDICRKLADADPANPTRQHDLASALNRLGDIKQHMGEQTAALEYYTRAVAAIDLVLPANPEDETLLRELAASAMKTGDVLSWLKDPAKATEQYQRSMDIIQTLHNRNPAAVRDVLNLSVAHNKLGYMAADSGDPQKALEHLQLGLQLLLDQSAKDPSNAVLRRNASVSHNQVGATLITLNRFSEALEHLNAALTIAQEMADADANDALAASDLAYTHNKVADLFNRRGDVPKALDHYRAALDIRERLSQRDPNNAYFLRDLAVSRSMVATAHQSLGYDQAQPLDERRSNLKQAHAWFEACMQVLIDMRTRNLLAERDVGLPDEVEEQIVKTNQAIAALDAPSAAPATQPAS